MRGKLIIDYTQGLAQVIITPIVVTTPSNVTEHQYRAFCDKKGCKEIKNFDNLEQAYDHSMDHHNKYHRL